MAIAAGKKAQVIECINHHPDWNDSRIAESIPCSRSWVQEVRAGLVPVYVEPKLLNVGANQHSGVDRSKKLGGNDKDYVVARLQRDGQQGLADQVKAGTKSARKAAIEAGFKVPESQLTAVKRAWKKPGAHGTDAQSETVPDNTSTAFAVPAIAPVTTRRVPGRPARSALQPGATEADARSKTAPDNTSTPEGVPAIAPGTSTINVKLHACNRIQRPNRSDRYVDPTSNTCPAPPGTDERDRSPDWHPQHIRTTINKWAMQLSPHSPIAARIDSQ